VRCVLLQLTYSAVYGLVSSSKIFVVCCASKETQLKIKPRAENDVRATPLHSKERASLGAQIERGRQSDRQENQSSDFCTFRAAFALENLLPSAAKASNA